MSHQSGRSCSLRGRRDVPRSRRPLTLISHQSSVINQVDHADLSRSSVISHQSSVISHQSSVINQVDPPNLSRRAERCGGVATQHVEGAPPQESPEKLVGGAAAVGYRERSHPL
eukprot:1088824-Prymnesium_polylepis.1